MVVRALKVTDGFWMSLEKIHESTCILKGSLVMEQRVYWERGLKGDTGTEEANEIIKVKDNGDSGRSKGGMRSQHI